MDFGDKPKVESENHVKLLVGGEPQSSGRADNGSEAPPNPSSESKSEIEVKSQGNDGIKRRFHPNQFLKFSSLVLVPGKPRKWKRVQRRFGRSEGAWLYRWEYIPESIDNLFMENLELMARGVIGPRRTGRTTRAVSFHMRENPAGSNHMSMYDVEGSYEQS